MIYEGVIILITKTRRVPYYAYLTSHGLLLCSKLPDKSIKNYQLSTFVDFRNCSMTMCTGSGDNIKKPRTPRSFRKTIQTANSSTK